MAEKYKATLTVNGNNIELTEFPLEFVTVTLAGAVSTLKKAEEIKDLDLTLNHGKVKLNVNAKPIPLGPFANLAMAKLLDGLVASLKGVEGEVVSLEMKMQAA